MSELREALFKYRADFIKLCVGLIALGVFYAQLPTRSGIKDIQDSLLELLDTQAHDLEEVRRDLIARPTRAELREILKTNENPWISVEPLVMQMVGNYDSERKQTAESLLHIRIDLGILKDALERRKNR